MSEGRTRQQPPTAEAPAAIHAEARAGVKWDGPVQRRAPASHRSPLFG
jgi:hypothetical protein